ncbi:nicotinate (nicotinamide) nucleotide adenylyltransferase [Prosthecochloris vibrioformis]|uniref:nicotinate (nicotinamide) nucleotide adenylyltransferase n=1 Tax=Prosthecochloris vibrioformis TaxID=1098 RepID=UPI001EED4501|nr:nicotinate (nicotinamide) nucleotide adenylyltransferase [Prosthecochloris vibrioformis]
MLLHIESKSCGISATPESFAVRLALFGGSFDPPHNAHLALCLYARELLKLDRLIISVSRNPFKEGFDASDSERCHMAGLLVQELNRTGNEAVLCDSELRRSQSPSYTIDMVRELALDYPGAELFLLIGEDNARGFRQWKNWQELRDKCRVVVFRRGGLQNDNSACAGEAFTSDIRFVHFDFSISSTRIRRDLAAGKECGRLLPKSIAGYIRQQGLYASSTSFPER